VHVKGEKMDKKDVAEKVLTYQTPVYLCRVDECKKKFKYRVDYHMHLAEEHTVKEILTGFDWKIENEEVVIKKNKLPGGLKYNDVKRWIEEFGEELVYEKVYFFVENWETARDIVDMIKKNEFITK